ncbi:glutathione S-transferase [Planoprotostelium fungivorum]|uniref:Glutathione S-transferase n=1 Tax=Planoprotostelium fungivorum TaxID=1890364 RepID=A0A2P6NUZ3_9EUKA|nr:glutathione S-transferase [Planoprotostelium fungivorum]
MYSQTERVYEYERRNNQTMNITSEGSLFNQTREMQPTHGNSQKTKLAMMQHMTKFNARFFSPPTECNGGQYGRDDTNRERQSLPTILEVSNERTEDWVAVVERMIYRYEITQFQKKKTTTRKQQDISNMSYKLYYWPGLPGRGEFVRLPFIFAGKPFEEDLDPKNMMSILQGPPQRGFLPLAPPFLRLPDGQLISQTPNIVAYLGSIFGLAGSNTVESLQINAVVLTALDFNNEIHNTHHPIAVGKTYEEQKTEALTYTKDFKSSRIPKFLGYFEKVDHVHVLTAQHGQIIAGNETSSGYLIGSSVSTADLTLFHIIEGTSLESKTQLRRPTGLLFAFPKTMKKERESKCYDRVFDLHENMRRHERIAAYLESGKRAPFKDGIFRYYQELDEA